MAMIWTYKFSYLYCYNEVLYGELLDFCCKVELMEWHEDFTQIFDPVYLFH